MKNITDTIRLNWLEKMSAHVMFQSEDEGALPSAKVFMPSFDGDQEYAEGDSYREAIDAAMQRLENDTAQ